MNNQTLKLLRSLRPPAASRVDELFPSEFRLELLGAIVGGPTAHVPAHRAGRSSQRRRRPLKLGLAGAATATAAAALVAALTAGSAVSPTPADAVSFRTASSGEIVATVTDPFAAQAQLNAAFAKQGLNITVNLVPVSPSIVGTVLYVGGSTAVSQIQSLQGGHCLTGGGCPIGLKIPKDFTGRSAITLGRPARRGEEYESATSAFAPGEPLHCSGLLGASVASATPALERDKLTMKWNEVESDPSNTSSTTRTLEQPPTHSYIWGAELSSPGHLTLTTEPRPWPNTPGAGAQFNKGC